MPTWLPRPRHVNLCFRRDNLREEFEQLRAVNFIDLARISKILILEKCYPEPRKHTGGLYSLAWRYFSSRILPISIRINTSNF